MANKLIVRTSVEPQYEVSETHSGKTYTSFKMDQIGGRLSSTMEDSFGDQKIYKLVGVVDVTAAAVVNDATTAFDGTATATGSVPTTVNTFYVKYDSALGSTATVTVTVGSQAHAVLSVGESVVVPIADIAVANCKIHTSVAYDDGVEETSVTVVLIGD